MISILKKKIKEILPDRTIYYYRVLQVFPEYFSSVTRKRHYCNSNIGFYSDSETVDFIVNNRYSLCRFGDGEFQWMLGEGKQYFQDQSDSLRDRLNEVFSSDVDKLLIGIPRGIFNSKECNLQAKLYWETINRTYMERIMSMRGSDNMFSDASISRPYIDYKSRQNSLKKFKELKRIWDNRDLMIVEGGGTKLGIGNDLLNNAKSISRIICPSKNAFNKIIEIEESISEHTDKDKQLILAALGPTATIISYDMCKKGYQIVDIGHVDVEYVWFLRHDLYRKPIEGKSVNESGDIGYSDSFNDEGCYIASIVDIVD